MKRSLVVTDSRIWTAEAEYACSVALAELGLGWDVTLAAPSASPVLRAVGDGPRVAELPGAEPGRSPADFLAGVRFLSGLAAAERYDVVHSSRSAAHVVTALAVGRRAPLVHLRGGAQAPRAHAVNRFLYRRMTDAVIVSSARVGNWVVERLSVPRDRVRRLLAPVDEAAFARDARAPELRAELGVPDTAPLIVNVGRLAPIKGQHVLVEAMSQVVAAHPSATLILVGEAWSGEPEGLLKLAAGLGLGGSVLPVGRRSDVPSFLAEASVCVSSSLGSEENSRAVGEYMAAGRPVVATSVGVIPELIEDGVAGLLAAAGDAPGLARGIMRMLDDTDLASRTGAAARAFAERELSRDAFARGLAGALERAGVGP